MMEQQVQKRKRGIETYGRILEKAAPLFACKGYDGVSMHEIAVAAGIRESSIYNHFESKAAILEALYAAFIERMPETRPSEAETDGMLAIMTPEEVLKTVFFHFCSHVDNQLASTAMIIQNERYKSKRAVEMYYAYVVREPADFYECLICKMRAKGMAGPVDARFLAEQYNYVMNALTKEYFLAKTGLADLQPVLDYIVKTIRFYCGLMKG